MGNVYGIHTWSVPIVPHPHFHWPHTHSVHTYKHTYVFHPRIQTHPCFTKTALEQYFATCQSEPWCTLSHSFQETVWYNYITGKSATTRVQIPKSRCHLVACKYTNSYRILYSPQIVFPRFERLSYILYTSNSMFEAWSGGWAPQIRPHTLIFLLNKDKPTCSCLNDSGW